MKNYLFPALPKEVLENLDPSAISYRKNTISKRASLPKLTDADIQGMRLRDRDKFLLVFLAAYGLVGNQSLTALLSGVPKGGSDKGFTAAMTVLKEQYGIVFDSDVVFGSTTKPEYAYDKLRQRANRLGLIRTVHQVSNSVHVRNALNGAGLKTGWVLTPKGAATLLKLTTRDDLTVDDIKFVVSEDSVSLVTQLHDLQMSDVIVQVLLGANYYTRIGIPTEVIKLTGEGMEFISNGKKFRPDLAGVIRMKSVFVPFFMEWDSGTTKSKDLVTKVERYMRMMINTEANKWSAGRPYLLMVHPEGGMYSNAHLKAIKEAAKQVGIDNKDYAPDFCGIAVCSHADLGEKGVYSNIWRVYDYSTKSLTEERFSLISLHRNKVKTPDVVVEPKKVEPTTATIPTPAHPGAVAVNGYKEPTETKQPEWLQAITG